MNNPMHPAEKVPVNRRPVIFIAGPMAGKPYFNRDEFYFAAKQLDDLDFIVLNPAIFPDGLQYRLAPSCAYAHKILLGLFVIYSAETNMSLLI